MTRTVKSSGFFIIYSSAPSAPFLPLGRAEAKPACIGAYSYIYYNSAPSALVPYLFLFILFFCLYVCAWGRKGRKGRESLQPLYTVAYSRFAKGQK